MRPDGERLIAQTKCLIALGESVSMAGIVRSPLVSQLPVFGPTWVWFVMSVVHLHCTALRTQKSIQEC